MVGSVGGQTEGLIVELAMGVWLAPILVVVGAQLVRSKKMTRSRIGIQVRSVIEAQHFLLFPLGSWVLDIVVRWCFSIKTFLGIGPDFVGEPIGEKSCSAFRLSLR